MSDRKIARKQPSGHSRVRHTRRLPPVTTQLPLSPPRHAQMRRECELMNVGGQASGAIDSDAANEGDAICER